MPDDGDTSDYTSDTYDEGSTSASERTSATPTTPSTSASASEPSTRGSSQRSPQRVVATPQKKTRSAAASKSSDDSDTDSSSPSSSSRDDNSDAPAEDGNAAPAATPETPPAAKPDPPRIDPEEDTDAPEGAAHESVPSDGAAQEPAGADAPTAVGDAAAAETTKRDEDPDDADATRSGADGDAEEAAPAVHGSPTQAHDAGHEATGSGEGVAAAAAEDKGYDAGADAAGGAEGAPAEGAPASTSTGGEQDAPGGAADSGEAPTKADAEPATQDEGVADDGGNATEVRPRDEEALRPPHSGDSDVGNGPDTPAGDATGEEAAGPDGVDSGEAATSGHDEETRQPAEGGSAQEEETTAPLTSDAHTDEPADPAAPATATESQSCDDTERTALASRDTSNVPPSRGTMDDATPRASRDSKRKRAAPPPTVSAADESELCSRYGIATHDTSFAAHTDMSASGRHSTRSTRRASRKGSATAQRPANQGTVALYNPEAESVYQRLYPVMFSASHHQLKKVIGKPSPRLKDYATRDADSWRRPTPPALPPPRTRRCPTTPPCRSAAALQTIPVTQFALSQKKSPYEREESWQIESAPPETRGKKQTCIPVPPPVTSYPHPPAHTTPASQVGAACVVNPFHRRQHKEQQKRKRKKGKKLDEKTGAVVVADRLPDILVLKEDALRLRCLRLQNKNSQLQQRVMELEERVRPA